MKWFLIGILCFTLTLTACAQDKPTSPPVKKEPAVDQKQEKQNAMEIKTSLVQKYNTLKPMKWGEMVEGVKTHLDTKEKVIALTFDACGGPNGNGFDEKLIQYLKQEKIPATLFINSRWIDANLQTFKDLANNPLFEIENHGTLHKPLSVSGKSAYGITGTQSVGEVVDEVLNNQQKILELTGKKPKYFRSGTAYYDDVAIKIAGDLGTEVVNYNVLGDAGATYSKMQVKDALLTATPGSIVIMHMNQPEKETAEGVILALPQLKKMGFHFVRLESYPLL